jgi:hypothetical protein
MKNKYAKGGHLESLDDTLSFGAAFKQASKTPGVATFSWRGKTFTTDTEKPSEPKIAKAAQTTVEKPVTPMAGRPKPTRSSTDMATLNQLRDNPVPSSDVIFRQTRKPELLNASASNSDSGNEFQTLKRGGSVSSASRRADGIAQRGKTRA